jgi:hypothetical protein
LYEDDKLFVKKMFTNLSNRWLERSISFNLSELQLTRRNIYILIYSYMELLYIGKTTKNTVFCRTAHYYNGVIDNELRKKMAPFFMDRKFYRIFALITHEAQAVRHTR